LRRLALSSVSGHSQVASRARWLGPPKASSSSACALWVGRGSGWPSRSRLTGPSRRSDNILA